MLPKELRDGRDVSIALREQVFDRAVKLLNDLNDLELNHDQDPEERNRQIIAAVRLLFCTYRPDKAGEDIYFGADDLLEADQKLRGILSDAQIDHLLAEALQRGIVLTREQMRFALSLAWCTSAKNILTKKDGALPVTSIEGMLRRFNYSHSNLRSLVRILLGTLETLGQIRCVDRRYGPRRCRRYAIAGSATARLPFVGRALADDERHETAKLFARIREQNEKACEALQHATTELIARADWPFSRVYGCYSTHGAVMEGEGEVATSPAKLERGKPKDLVADGQWHLYSWALEDAEQWEDFAGGDGVVNGPITTVDSVCILSRTNQDAVVYLDTLFYNPSGSVDPVMLQQSADDAEPAESVK